MFENPIKDFQKSCAFGRNYKRILYLRGKFCYKNEIFLTLNQKLE